MTTASEKILILDFGAQYTQLIARRIRELGVFSEIVPFNYPLKKLMTDRPKGIILSGGPSSVHDKNAPMISKQIFRLGIPILGICYGQQLISYLLSGEVRKASNREYGYAVLENHTDSPLFDRIPKKTTVWMSHGDDVVKLPTGFSVVSKTKSVIAAIQDTNRGIYGVQFHPEVTHTQYGRQFLDNFLKICKVKRNWTMHSFVKAAIAEIKQTIGDDKVICALSGGVDSSVAATLVDKAVGKQQTCIFVNTGLLRKNEFTEVLTTYNRLKLNVVGVDASTQFLKALKGVTDPEEKRKIIGHKFIEVFDKEAKKIKGVKFLVQGTLYPDVIESISVKGPSAVIKSHHNVGGLPKKMNLELIEPLKELFKDEVRQVGKEIGIPKVITERQPFPGPGLAVRILGAVTAKRIAVLQAADAIVTEEIRKAKLYSKIWQSFAVLLPVSSVGVMGDERTYENVVALRTVESVDGMTANWVELPYEVMRNISSRIINEVKGVNRVVYDISSKPPATIEWE